MAKPKAQKYKQTIVKDGFMKNSTTIHHNVMSIQSANKKKFLNTTDLKTIYTTLKTKFENSKKTIKNVQIVGANPINGFFTLMNKTKFIEDFEDTDFLEYFENRVQNTEKFDKFSSFTVSISYTD